MDLEAKSLLVAAERARVLDHNGNRGSDAEHAIREWLRRRVEPEYTVSSGEIIDTFNTDADLKSRQQDIIIHLNSRESNRLVLPSGLRLIPIEVVAAVVEVKLTIDKTKLLDSDRAAIQTANLRLAVEWTPPPASGAGGVSVDTAAAKAFNRDKAPHGVRLWDRDLRNRTTFAVFGFNGTSDPRTMAEWMKETTRVSLAACLEAGCIFRRPPSGDVRESWEKRSIVYPQEETLMAFASRIDIAIANHRDSSSKFVGCLDRYTQPQGAPLEDSPSCE